MNAKYEEQIDEVEETESIIKTESESQPKEKPSKQTVVKPIRKLTAKEVSKMKIKELVSFVWSVCLTFVCQLCIISLVGGLLLISDTLKSALQGWLSILVCLGALLSLYCTIPYAAKQLKKSPADIGILSALCIVKLGLFAAILANYPIFLTFVPIINLLAVFQTIAFFVWINKSFSTDTIIVIITMVCLILAFLGTAEDWNDIYYVLATEIIMWTVSVFLTKNLALISQWKNPHIKSGDYIFACAVLESEIITKPIFLIINGAKK
ncbi:unnamed protein product [Blepharisma stoltei]|uniref:Uncharacterized protein n=1 Tax=Blepharisma stoltei TaxID=1481888 RepID=A0AAU9K6W6_9CILI|nr:unnamed protein product [Blepharisma stoltei]